MLLGNYVPIILQNILYNNQNRGILTGLAIASQSRARLGQAHPAELKIDRTGSIFLTLRALSGSSPSFTRTKQKKQPKAACLVRE